MGWLGNVKLEFFIDDLELAIDLTTFLGESW